MNKIERFYDILWHIIITISIIIGICVILYLRISFDKWYINKLIE